MDFVYRMKHVREGERRSRRKLGLSPELKTYPFEPGVPRFWYKLAVEVPVPVPVEATTPELPRDLQNIAVVTSVARPVVSSPTPNDNNIANIKSSTSTPPSPTSLESWDDVYGLQHLLCCHLHPYPLEVSEVINCMLILILEFYI
jgi:hypothetical protein